MKYQRVQVGNGQTLTTDHVMTEFRVVVRSLNSVHTETIKNLIEQRHEVVVCEYTGYRAIYDPGLPDFVGDRHMPIDMVEKYYGDMPKYGQMPETD